MNEILLAENYTRRVDTPLESINIVWTQKKGGFCFFSNRKGNTNFETSIFKGRLKNVSNSEGVLTIYSNLVRRIYFPRILLARDLLSKKKNILRNLQLRKFAESKQLKSKNVWVKSQNKEEKNILVHVYARSQLEENIRTNNLLPSYPTMGTHTFMFWEVPVAQWLPSLEMDSAEPSSNPAQGCLPFT